MKVYYSSISCPWLCSLDTIFQCKCSILRIVAIYSCQVDSKHQYEHPKVSFVLRIGIGTDKWLSRQTGVSYFARITKLPVTRLCKLVLMEVEYSNTSPGWNYLDLLKFVINNIGFDHLINNEINLNTFKRFFRSCVRKREFDCVDNKCSLEFFKNACIFQGKQPYFCNVVEF